MMYHNNNILIIVIMVIIRRTRFRMGKPPPQVTAVPGGPARPGERAAAEARPVRVKHVSHRALYIKGVHVLAILSNSETNKYDQTM